ncbi:MULTISPECIES: terminase TerL endonuclease subunit [unclassified Chelatococcus]|nr:MULTISPECIES: terminase TerL endonuclease subunit [unclassified Chelatococcus]CAH1662819.1 Phage terminase large subunit-like protein [Hyphomicrobiales bacterium]MBS7741485.1 terminase large subunit [Chelatococcus sp. HY11]MBX3544496.1 terminase large subunit [Chelatococcus sp.]MCO5078981.1 terminase large subunit [Chelatococcus sp.]CAH1682517.1 Phage terminase large subunit-like protein [Hyphomicrobiales bacterium]
MTAPAWVFDDSPIPDPDGRAARVLTFSELLRHPKSEAAGQRLVLTRWQRRILSRIYGPSDDAGRRQVRTVFLMLPRGNRKTSLASVIALAHTIGPEQVPAGQVISAASDRSQARIAFDEAKESVLLDERIHKACRVRDTKSRIEHPKSRSVYQAISADGDAQHGKTPTVVLADEVHVWKGYELWSALKTGLSKVPGSLLIVTTTMGPEEGVNPLFDELYAYALKVAAGEIDDPSFLPILFSAPDHLAWDDEEGWRLANPGLVEGDFPDLPSLHDEVRLAREIPRMRIEFERLHLNRRPKTSATGGLIDMAVFDECREAIDPADLEGEACWIGLDMSRTYDLTAIVVCFRRGEDFLILPFPILPETALRKRQAETSLPMRQWERDQHLTVLPGDIIGDDAIEAKLRELNALYDVQSIAYDPKFAVRLASRLAEDDLPMVEFPQLRSLLGPAYAILQRLFIARRIRHDGSPVLRWNIQSAHVDISDGTSLPFIRKTKSKGSVDLIVAAAMAVSQAEAGESNALRIYETERPDGLLFL